MTNMTAISIDTAIRDVAFEIVLGGDRFDKEDIGCILKDIYGEHGFTEEVEAKFREQVKAEVRKLAPPEHDVDNDDYYKMAIKHWTHFPELRKS